MGVLGVDGTRLWRDMMGLAALTDPAQPYTRRSFSPLFLEGRAYLAHAFKEAGLEVRIDPAGNLIGRREGKRDNAATIMIGSHSDTVPAGGRFDGVAGVVAALEVARALRDHHIVLDHALEIVDFLAEEPSEYGLSCVGSRGMSGNLTAKELSLTCGDGETLYAAIGRVGGVPEQISQAIRSDIAACFELHIEQGPVLEATSTDIGIVSAIVGIVRVRIVFQGRADHAGTTPMDRRSDALYAAAQTIVAIREQAERASRLEGGYFVATTGIVEVHPGASNVVSDRSHIIIDIRSANRQKMENFLEFLDRESCVHAVRADVKRVAFERLSDTREMTCHENLMKRLEISAQQRGLSHRQMASGAGHDTAFIGQIAPAAMVFIPCKGGKSHTPEEWAEKEHIAAGAATILGAVIDFDRME